jgi:hypothetical protein
MFRVAMLLCQRMYHNDAVITLLRVQLCSSSETGSFKMES